MDLSPFFKPSGPGALNEHQAKQLLNQYGIPVVQEHLATDAEQAAQAACRIGFPVVVKGIGAQMSGESNPSR